MPTPENDARMTQDFHWYLEHQREMVERYNGRVIAIQDGIVLGDYRDYREAIVETERSHEPETFIIQLVTPGEEAYTATIYSPAMLQ